jgi:hypothetical protein
MTRIVVEGPDGAGKTNLIERLVAQTNYELMERASDSVRGPVNDLSGYVERDVYDREDNDRLYDRHPLISDLIYGPVIRGQIGFDDRSLGWLTGMLEMFYGHRPLVVYCLPPWSEVHRNVQEGVHMSGVSVNIHKVYQLYYARHCLDAAAGRWVFHWDYTRPQNFDHLLALTRMGV